MAVHLRIVSEFTVASGGQLKERKKSRYLDKPSTSSRQRDLNSDWRSNRRAFAIALWGAADPFKVEVSLSSLCKESFLAGKIFIIGSVGSDTYVNGHGSIFFSLGELLVMKNGLPRSLLHFSPVRQYGGSYQHSTARNS